MSDETNAILKLVKDNSRHPRVAARLKLNSAGGGVLPTPAMFWESIVKALVTTQQKSTEGSNVSKFVLTQPFPLSLPIYKKLNDSQVIAVLQKHRIGFRKRIAELLREDYRALFVDGNCWAEIRPLLKQLVQQRNCEPSEEQKDLERKVARVLHMSLVGIGPKQSRNALQKLCLIRYEIPLDSRVTGWLNENLGWGITNSMLGPYKSYEGLLDRVQIACKSAGVLPTVFDGAAFVIGKSRTPAKRSSTELGYLNRSGQVVIRNTGLPGTDHLQTVYQLGCSLCGHVYGANGSDIFQRKCPKCQGGLPGLAYD